MSTGKMARMIAQAQEAVPEAQFHDGHHLADWRAALDASVVFVAVIVQADVGDPTALVWEQLTYALAHAKPICLLVQHKVHLPEDVTATATDIRVYRWTTDAELQHHIEALGREWS